MNCVCIVHLICLNLCVQAGPTSNLLDESELLTGWEVLAIKNRMREVQAMKAKELVGKMTGEYNLRNKHEVKRKVQLQFLRQVI
mgnify:CR=1 FL=1